MFLVMFVVFVCVAWLLRVEEEQFISAKDQELRTGKCSKAEDQKIEAEDF